MRREEQGDLFIFSAQINALGHRRRTTGSHWHGTVPQAPADPGSAGRAVPLRLAVTDGVGPGSAILTE